MLLFYLFILCPSYLSFVKGLEQPISTLILLFFSDKKKKNTTTIPFSAKTGTVIFQCYYTGFACMKRKHKNKETNMLRQDLSFCSRKGRGGEENHVFLFPPPLVESKSVKIQVQE